MTPTEPSAILLPRSIPRAEHGISRKQISPNALRVLYKLREAGFGAYLVGGAVRDLLLGRAPKDFDVATDATPEQVRQLFRNCRLIGRRFRLAHILFGGEIIEVATFRAGSDDGSGERELDDGRLLRDNVYGSIEDDALRRDFTANALYYAIEDFSVRDYVGGYEDVRTHTLRLIGEPEQRYREDPVRMLRAARFAAKLAFKMEAATATPIPQLAGLLAQAAPARLFEETLKLFLSGHGEKSWLALEQHALLPVLFPETLAVLERSPASARQMLRVALANTDRRLAEDKSVTPAFLFAALLWPAYQAQYQTLFDEGMDIALAHQRAADRVTFRQSERIALPRRFTTPMQEIWELQARFSTRQPRRVFRLLAHPRFRAALDFLELRASADNSLLPEAQWWRQAHESSSESLALSLTAGSDRALRKKPRRRRRKAVADNPVE